MKILAFDENEKFIVKGVIESLDPKERPDALFQFLEGQFKSMMYATEPDEILLLDILGHLYGKLADFDDDELQNILQQDLKSVFEQGKQKPPYGRSANQNRKEGQ